MPIDISLAAPTDPIQWTIDLDDMIKSREILYVSNETTRLGRWLDACYFGRYDHDTDTWNVTMSVNNLYSLNHAPMSNVSTELKTKDDAKAWCEDQRKTFVRNVMACMPDAKVTVHDSSYMP